MNTCLWEPMDEDGNRQLEHWVDGGCTEANVLRLVHQKDLPEFGEAVPNRFVVWQAKAGDKSGGVAAPCHKGKQETDKNGCWETFTREFQLNSLPPDIK